MASFPDNPDDTMLLCDDCQDYFLVSIAERMPNVDPYDFVKQWDGL